MYLGLILDMAHSGLGDRDAITVDGLTVDHTELAERSWAASARFLELGVPSVVYLGTNHIAYPVALFGAAGAGIPFIPLNYRLGPDQLAAQLDAHPGAFVICEGDPPAQAAPGRWAERQAFLDSLDPAGAEPPLPPDPDATCLLLYTSGTTAAPKAAVLRHRHLMSYLLGTVEFASADEDERDEKVTQAMVVPTMLAQIVDHLRGADDADTPSLRTLSYGGARMPEPVLHRALELFPTTGFVNAYGLTETSSTIALLGPDEHRAAFDSDDPVARARLGSVGRLVPGVEIEVRDDEGGVLGVGRPGLVFLRGEQISGEYAGVALVGEDGWFPTRDRGWVDEDGYVFIEGRADDTIIRGGENIAPAEIEDVLLSHEGIVDAVVVGLPDDRWGQRLVAVVVAGPGAGADEEELRQLVRGRLRSSKTPEVIEFWPELPRTDTGKLLRRTVVARLSEG